MRLTEKIPSTIPLNGHRFYVFFNYMIIFGFVGHILILPIYFYFSKTSFLMSGLLAIIIDFIIFKLNRMGYMNTASSVWVFLVFIRTVYANFTFGWTNGFQLYLLSLVIIVGFSNWRFFLKVIIWAILSVTVFIMYYYDKELHGTIIPPSEYTYYAILIFNVIANFSAVACATVYYRKYAEQIELKLHELAHTDMLTKIPNRRAFEQAALVVLERAKNEQKPYALIAMDIDYFKMINDTYGHASGDIVLQKIAELVATSVRKSDVIGRIGGEEFGILLQDVNVKQAVYIANQLLEKIEQTHIQILDGKEIRVTASMGLTMGKEEESTLSTIMIRSDIALYQAKNEGRNKVVIN